MKCRKCDGEMLQLVDNTMSKVTEHACLHCNLVIGIKMSSIHPDQEIGPRSRRPLMEEDMGNIILEPL